MWRSASARSARRYAVTELFYVVATRGGESVTVVISDRQLLR
jgi:hypothetical protein